MKMITIALGALILMVALNSCKKGLDATIYGSLSPLNFPKTESDYELYTLEAYLPFESKWSYYDPGSYENMFHGVDESNIVMNDASSDLFISHQRSGESELFAEANFVGLVNLGRMNHFEQIRFITRLTKMADDVSKATTISDAAKLQFTAEIRMARGFLMYYLLTLYGPVPVILDPAKIGTSAENDLTRPAMADYVTALTADLSFAAANLVKAPAQYGRFNEGLALAILMRTYLFEKDYVNAEKTGRVILTLGYSLVSDYKSLFREATEVNNETIWAVSCDPNGDGSASKPNFNPWGKYEFPSDYPGELVGTTYQGGWSGKGAIIPSWTFYDSFDPADTRRQCLLSSYTNFSGVLVTRANMLGPIMNKYPDETPGPFSGNDIPIVRYADVLLMMAEAINGQNGPTPEAVGFVNQVRTRAGIANLSAADIASKDAFSTAILRERGWELYFEGFRRVDLMRFGKWNEYLTAAGKTPNPAAANGYLPIPTYAIIEGAGKLTQTPGY